MIQDISPSKLFNTDRPDAKPEADSVIFFFRDGCAAVRLSDSPEIPAEMPRFRECPQDVSYIYLFTIDTCMWFLPSDPALEPPAGFTFDKIRFLRDQNAISGKLAFCLFTAMPLAGWYRDNVYCGTCGSRTHIGSEERSIICPACGRTLYPRIIPAVIVGVTKGDYLLHTKYANRAGISYYALIAGFTEIGETLEETVAREVMEEVGLRVKNIRYFASQPWGIVDDLLAGFYCDVDGPDEISLDTGELKEAVWIPRNEITGQPNDFSLTNYMMMTFRDGLEPRA